MCPSVRPEQLRGIELTRPGVRTYADELVRRTDPYGKPYYWIYCVLPTDVADDGTDVGAVANDMVSITPIGLDMTEHSVQGLLRQWTFDTLLVRGAAYAGVVGARGLSALKAADLPARWEGLAVCVWIAIVQLLLVQWIRQRTTDWLTFVLVSALLISIPVLLHVIYRTWIAFSRWNTG